MPPRAFMCEWGTNVRNTETMSRAGARSAFATPCAFDRAPRRPLGRPRRHRRFSHRRSHDPRGVPPPRRGGDHPVADPVRQGDAPRLGGHAHRRRHRRPRGGDGGLRRSLAVQPRVQAHARAGTEGVAGRAAGCGWDVAGGRIPVGRRRGTPPAFRSGPTPMDIRTRLERAHGPPRRPVAIGGGRASESTDDTTPQDRTELACMATGRGWRPRQDSNLQPAP